MNNGYKKTLLRLGAGLVALLAASALLCACGRPSEEKAESPQFSAPAAESELPAGTEPAATEIPTETELPATEVPASQAPTALPAPETAEEAEPPAMETAPAETPDTYVPVPTPVTEPDEDSLIGQPILFRAGDVTIYAESLHRTDSGLEFQASLLNGGGETATWTFASVTLDGNTLKVNDACEIPAGHTILYTYTLNNPLVGLLIRSGDHTVSVHSVLTGADGTLIGEGDSDTVTITVQ